MLLDILDIVEEEEEEEEVNLESLFWQADVLLESELREASHEREEDRRPSDVEWGWQERPT
tara:strand:- start:562 stop:744 length:183 start_codon:yes stop_codon:yes gene_type:complete